MTVQTISIDSNLMCNTGTSYSTGSLSAVGVRLFATTRRTLFKGCSSSAHLWFGELAMREGYQSMSPVNSALVKEFAPKVRRGWPDW